MNNYNFLKICKEILRFFENLSKFSRKFREKLRKFWKYGFVTGSAAELPPKLAKLFKKVTEKSMET